MGKSTAKIEKAIKEWFGSFEYVTSQGIKLSEPIFDENEIIAVIRTLLLSNGWIAQGPKIAEFESDFSKFEGSKYAVAVNSGSSANLLGFAALKELGYIREGDEVIVPAATFPTVASPILQLGLKPVFVDVGLDGNIEPSEIDKAITKKTKIIMVVHTLGKPVDMKKIMQIAKKNKLLIFEDCCEAHGAEIGNKKVGTFGAIGTFSFYVAHNMTTGEGGMVVTNKEDIAQMIKSLREFGRYKGKGVEERFNIKDPVLGYYDTRYLFSYLGYNLRMSDIEAALGVEQLKKLPQLNKTRNINAVRITKGIEKFSNYLILPEKEIGTEHAFYGYLLVVKKNSPFKRIDLVSFLEKKKIETRPLFGGCLPDQPAFRGRPLKTIGKLPVSRFFRDNAIFLGCHPGLSKRDISYIINSFEEFFKNLNP